MSLSNRHLPNTLEPGDAWLQHAVCRAPGVDPDVMFPDNNIDEIKTAKSICRPCPVIEACLQAALDEEAGTYVKNRHGIRGGQTPSQRHHAYEDGLTAAQVLAREWMRTAPSDELLQHLYDTHTVPSGDGHLIWTGPHPTVTVRDARLTVGRLAFQVGVGRKPDGAVQRSCDRDKCFLPGHLTDRTMHDSAKAAAGRAP